MIEQFDTDSKCFTYKITKDTDTKYEIIKRREFKTVNDIGISHTNSLAGSIHIKPNGGDTELYWDTSKYF